MTRPVPARLPALEVTPAAAEECFRIAIDASYCGEDRPGAPEAG